MTPKKILRMLIVKISYYLWVLLLFSLVTFFFNKTIAIFELAVFVSLLVQYVLSYAKEQKKFDKYVENIALNVEKASQDSIFNFTLPVVILKSNGSITWYNDEFASLISQRSDITDRNFAYDKGITNFIENFPTNIDQKTSSKILFELNFNSKFYRVFGNVSLVDDTDETITILYFDDKTDSENLKKRYVNEKFVSAIIVCDNYDDVIQDTPAGDRPMLIATLDNIISGLSSSVKGILKKQEKDRYFFYFEKRYLDKFEEEKFEILKAVKEIRVGNKLPITLSIGIGCNGSSMAENDSYSQIALDMALGRGGDQVVIKDIDQYKFYGGTSKEVEKRTKVRARVVSYALKELMIESENIIIMGHKNADMDACGAAIGIYALAKSLKKEAKIVMQTSNLAVNMYIDSLGEEYDDVFINTAYAGEIISEKTLLVIVDTHKTSLVEVPSLLDLPEKIVIIDHHRKSADFIEKTVMTYHEPYASSASELVTEILHYMDDSTAFTKKVAEGLYAGIYLDTKNFTFKAGVRTFEAASILKRIGVDMIHIKKLFQVDFDDVNKRMKIVENAYFYNENIAIATCKENGNDMQTIVAQAADEMLNIKGVISSFVICQKEENNVFISARSFGQINVQIILEKFGGGGHMTMAGAQVANMSVYDAVEKIKKLVDEQLNK